MDKARIEALADAYVAAGVRKLNRYVPGWERRVRRKTLNIRSTNSCLLQQVFGSFDTAMMMLFASNLQKAATCGFALGSELMTWEALQAAWDKQLDPLLGKR